MADRTSNSVDARPAVAARRRVIVGHLGAVIPLGAVLAAFLIGAIMIAALGANPITGFVELFVGAFGGADQLAESAARAMPLLLVGTGICIAFRARVINIGGEGQIIAGAIASTVTALALPGLPRVLLIPLVLLMGVVGGAVWGGIPGGLKAYLGVNEILSTIMLNLVAVQLMNYLLRAPLIDPKQVELGTRIPQTRRLSENADLPILVPGTRLHLGVLIAVIVAVGAWFLLWRTTLGFRVRAVGAGAPAARYAGMPVKRMTMLSLTLSGAMCGLAGAVLVFGSESHRLLTDGSATGFTGSAGFNGIVAALFGALNPIYTIPSSFLFGGLLVGANAMQRAIQIPAALVVALNGLVVVFVVSSNSIRQRLSQVATMAAEAAAAPGAAGGDDQDAPGTAEVVDAPHGGSTDSRAGPKP